MTGLEISSSKRTTIFVVIMIASVATSALSTAFATALYPICDDFNIDVTTGQWMTSGYTLTQGIIMPLTAYLIRRFPTRRLYLGGIVIAIVGLTVSLIAPNFPVMMVGRVFQACGNGMLFAMAQVIILTIYPPERRGFMMGIYGMASTVAPVFAPTLGGILVDAISWRAIFGFVLVVVVIALIMALVVFRNILETVPKHFDFYSFVLTVLGFGGITLGVGNIGTYGITNPAVWVALVVGIVALILFVRRQLRLKEPLIDVRMYKSREYSIATVSYALVYFIMFGSSVLMPLYAESALGLSATIAGLITLPGSAAMAIFSPFAGRIYDRLGIKVLFVIGGILLFISNFGMVFVTLDTSIAVATVLNVFRSLGIGCTMMPLITWGTSHVRHELVADATAMLSSLGTIGGSIGSAVLVAVMSAVAAGTVGVTAEAAEMAGVNVAYAVPAAIGVVLFLIAVFLVKGKKKQSPAAPSEAMPNEAELVEAASDGAAALEPEAEEPTAGPVSEE